jgi:hypothetical protein
MDGTVGLPAELMAGAVSAMKPPQSKPQSPSSCHMRGNSYAPSMNSDQLPTSGAGGVGNVGALVPGQSFSLPGAQTAGSDDRGGYPGSAAEHRAVPGTMGEPSDGAVIKQDVAGRSDAGIPADDSKVLANPKGIIKSYLPQAAAMDAAKFAAYRELCFAHVDEYHKHQKGGVWAQCRLCRGTFRHWNTLQRHLQSHIDFRPFACGSCGRAFYSQSKLKRHAVVHSEVKPYPCPVCDRRLGRTEHLKRHLLVHTDAKPYGCSACAHTTKRLDGIRRHIKRKHGATGGAEIVGLEVPAPAVHGLADQPQVTGDPNEPPKPKPKKKKKKKKKAATPAPADVRPNGEVSGSKDCASLIDVAMRFGINDLRMPSTSGEAGRYFSESPAPPPKDMSRYGAVQNPPDEAKQMQLLYQSLARSHASSQSVAHAGSSPSAGPGRGPVNLLSPAHLAQPHPFSPGHQHRHAALQLPHADHGFLMNSGVGGAAAAMPAAAAAAAMRYVPAASDGSGRTMNPVIFAPAPAGHFPGADTDMISQYIHSQQRFVPPVWGIANPNFPNY